MRLASPPWHCEGTSGPSWAVAKCVTTKRRYACLGCSRSASFYLRVPIGVFAQNTLASKALSSQLGEAGLTTPEDRGFPHGHMC